MMLLSNLPKPAIIAHRGASSCAPENTLAAFKLALQQGADAIELDAKLSADGYPVVIHDQTVDRTTPLTGKVNEHIMADLHRMDAGSHFDIAFKGESIPSLEDVFKAVGQLTYINVELTNLKSQFDPLPEKVAELVKQYKLNGRVFFSSFSIISLIRIHRLLPDSPIGLLTTQGWKGVLVRGLMELLTPYQSLHPHLSDATLQLIQAAQKKGRKVFVYTVNKEEDMQRLFEAGVDGIFTDDPLFAREVLEKMRRSIR